MKAFWQAVVWGLIGMASSIIQGQVGASGSPSVTVAGRSALVIGPGDLLDLSVFNVPELVLKVRVDADGFVSLPLIGEQKLAGMTVRDAQSAIAHELVVRRLVNQPQVSIFSEEFATQGITVYGEVSAPGIFPLMGPHRLYDAIAAAGGLTQKSGRLVTILHAGQNGPPELINLTAGVSDEQQDVTIYPGDTVIVSKTGMVYVLGEVNKPGAFLMENNTSMSFLKVIALAQGTTKVASLKHALILKQSPDGTVKIKVSLDKLYQGETSDLQLHAEDIVFVPLSNVKSYSTMGLQAAIQASLYTLYATELK